MHAAVPLLAPKDVPNLPRYNQQTPQPAALPHARCYCASRYCPSKL